MLLLYSSIQLYCCFDTLTSTQRREVCSRGRDAGWSREWGGLTKLVQTDTRLAVRARPLSGRLPPLGPCRTTTRHRHCLQHQARLSPGQRQAEPLPPVLPPYHRAPMVKVSGREFSDRLIKNTKEKKEKKRGPREVSVKPRYFVRQVFSVLTFLELRTRLSSAQQRHIVAWLITKFINW